MLVLQIVQRHHQLRHDDGRALTGVISGSKREFKTTVNRWPGQVEPMDAASQCAAPVRPETTRSEDVFAGSMNASFPPDFKPSDTFLVEIPHEQILRIASKYPLKSNFQG